MIGEANFRPTAGKLLVKIIDESTTTEKGILLPDSVHGPLIKAEVIALGPDVGVSFDRISKGQLIYFFRDAEIRMMGGDELAIVPINAVVGFDDLAVSEADRLMKSIDSDDFMDEDYHYWRNWELVRQFQFSLGYMNCQDDVDLINIAYNVCYDVLKKKLIENIDPIKIERESKAFGGMHDSVNCEDDKWGARLIHDDERNRLFLRMSDISIRTLAEILPDWIEIINRIIRHPRAIPVFGQNLERIILSEFSVEQIIILEHKKEWKDKVRNSEVMSGFLRIGKDNISPPLEALGLSSDKVLESLGRVDVKLSFEREIGDYTFLIWLDARAPKNDDFKNLHIIWQIQDIFPTMITSGRYDGVLDDFFRDTIFKKFYKEWFTGIETRSKS